jgi:uncharacterized membrane protein
VGLKHDRRVKSIALIALLAACGKPASDESAAAGDTTPQRPAGPVASAFTRGIVQLGPPVRITRCGGVDTLTVADAGGKLESARKQMSGTAQSSKELFIIATAQDANGQLTLADVLYASPEKFDCFTDWQSFDYRATGNNPGWVAEVRGNQVKLERQGADPAEWYNATRDSTANSLRIKAGGSDGKPFELLLERRACANSVSGAYSAWSAQATVAGVVLKGCSVNGG